MVWPAGGEVQPGADGTMRDRGCRCRTVKSVGVQNWTRAENDDDGLRKPAWEEEPTSGAYLRARTVFESAVATLPLMR